MIKCRNIILYVFLFAAFLGCKQKNENENKSGKPVIYQLVVRLFGNQNSTNKYYGSIQENGVGKLDDINDKALDSLKALGITYIWYTGILEHATMTDYSKYGIKVDDPDVVKGRAGSPYAVKDYYDVDPDLAVNVQNRMAEFQALIDRTHHHQLKAIIDFIPNHVARGYFSDAKPDSVIGFGEQDDTSVAFSPHNDFYYIPKSQFIVPRGADAGGPDFHSKLKDGKFDEHPAKATGNNVFRPDPSIDDWYETIKLNYGVDVMNGDKEYFTPLPPVWKKMRDILVFWAQKGVDGFRCDVAEMVPVAFWHWVIPQVKKVNPQIIFIAEAYTPGKYEQYLNYGGFDYLYNKVGLYDALKKLIKNDSGASVSEIDTLMHFQKKFSSHMLNFLENHDEKRIASKQFADNPFLAEPAMVVAATISNAPVMIYFGQELGEKAERAEGFGADDGKTTIFDYWGVPAVQQWTNGGKFDGGKLSERQKDLRNFYQRLLHIAGENTALYKGDYQVVRNKDFNDKQLAYLRFNGQQKILIAVNFDRKDTLKTTIQLSKNTGNTKIFKTADNLFTQEKQSIENGIAITVPPSGYEVLKLD
ncbi:alpha-amylase family glycosyl hydrolase [Arachidicoccus sp.]|uniref:alpha-amylase family glycosyl hydrolase n=1 Tax=Arachidicoccus sp. TaxID=1872624 RepID=UPI003D198D46